MKHTRHNDLDIDIDYNGVRRPPLDYPEHQRKRFIEGEWLDEPRPGPEPGFWRGYVIGGAVMLVWCLLMAGLIWVIWG